jgi:hypothetical protein
VIVKKTAGKTSPDSGRQQTLPESRRLLGQAALSPASCGFFFD